MMEVTNDLIRYFDMFAGIGGFRAGLTRAGGFQIADKEHPLPRLGDVEIGAVKH